MTNGYYTSPLVLPIHGGNFGNRPSTIISKRSMALTGMLELLSLQVKKFFFFFFGIIGRGGYRVLAFCLGEFSTYMAFKLGALDLVDQTFLGILPCLGSWSWVFRFGGHLALGARRLWAFAFVGTWPWRLNDVRVLP